MLGRSIARLTCERFEVSGSYFKSPFSMDGVHSLQMDATDRLATQNALRLLKPDVIFHTAAMTNVDQCESNPVLANLSNVEASNNIASIAKEMNSKLVHVSTDQLFDGACAWKTEDDEPAPLNVYAKTKLRAENVVLNECSEALVIRTNFFGWCSPGRTSFSDWILQGLKQGQELTMFSDVFFNPILIDHLVDVVVNLIYREAVGVFNVAGATRLSKFDFAMQLSKVFGYPANRIRDTSVSDFPFKAQRPNDMSLSVEKVTKYLKRKMPSVSEGIDALHTMRPSDWN